MYASGVMCHPKRGGFLVTRVVLLKSISYGLRPKPLGLLLTHDYLIGFQPAFRVAGIEISSVRKDHVHNVAVVDSLFKWVEDTVFTAWFIGADVVVDSSEHRIAQSVNTDVFDEIFWFYFRMFDDAD